MKQLTAKQGWTHRLDDLAAWPAKALKSAWAMALEWQSRARSRRHLDTLDDHLLRDVGLTRDDVRHELDKPFWRLKRD